MKVEHIFVPFHVLLTACVLVDAFNPLQTVLDFSQKIYSHLRPESCSSNWIAFNVTGLKNDLDNKLFGQHIASRVILKAVNRFMSDNNPKKPLVLSLHGTTGTGKNFVSQLIAENIYKEGTRSKFFHLSSSTLHLPHVNQSINVQKLQQWIKRNIINCERSMFVFDEMDKMQPGLIDSIKPFLEYNDTLDGISCRKSIFIFLSNAGGNSITETALNFWRAGRDREDIELKDLETSLSQSVFNNFRSGLFQSSLIDDSLIDFFIPFLPLRYKHVFQCIMAEMKARGLKQDQDLADKMARDFDYFPKFESIFSVYGCKSVANKLHFYM